MRRWQTLLLALVVFGAAGCDLTVVNDSNDDNGTEPSPPTTFPNPTGEEEGVTLGCQSAGVSCMIWYEGEDYQALYDGTLLILADPGASAELLAEASIFNTVAALRLGQIDVETAEKVLADTATALLDSDTLGVLQEGLLEVYVLLGDGDKSAAVVAEADESVIERFYLLRPELVADFERLVPTDLFDQPPLAPSG